MSKFKNKILEVVRLVPKGYVVSYGQVALMAGIPRAARQVGWVLHQIDETDLVPWWRVINNAGRISTKCPEHTPLMQKELLEKEGVEVTKHLRIDIEKYRFRPDPGFLNELKLDNDYISMVVGKYGV